MSHFEKVGVIFITGLVAIILALSLFGSGKQDPDSAVALQEHRFSTPPPEKPPFAARRETSKQTKAQEPGKDTTILWDAVVHAGKGGAGTPRSTEQKLTSNESPLSPPKASSLDRTPFAASTGGRSATIPIDEEAMSGAVSKDVEHIVGDGESYYTLARRYYHDGTKWQVIRDRNRIPAEKLRAGTKLVIPTLAAKRTTTGASAKDLPRETPPLISASPSPDPESPNDNAASARTYRVKRGDTLSEIAQSQLGTVKAISKLLDANRGLRIDDPLREGTLLRLPPQ